jgi:NADH-quinone oxidoreductase subunit N
MVNPVTGIDLLASLPIAVAALTAFLCLLLEVYQRPSLPRDYIGVVGAAGLALAGLAAGLQVQLGPIQLFGGLAVLDAWSCAATALYCLGGAITCLVASGYLEARSLDRGEFYALVCLAVVGMSVMTMAGDLMTLFLGLEIQSICAYALAGYLRRSVTSIEAGLKYFLLGALATAFFLYGTAFLYGVTGTTRLSGIADALGLLGGTAQRDGALTLAVIQGTEALAAGVDPATGDWNWGVASPLPLAVIGMGMLLVAMTAKVAAAPFHMWAPDAYSGAPMPAAGLLSSTVKAAGILTLARVILTAFPAAGALHPQWGWMGLFAGMAVLTMWVGNLSALVQTSPRRMLAWSSVAHAGYLLVGLTALGWVGAQSVALAGLWFYLLAYTASSIGAFAVLSMLHVPGSAQESWDDLNGLGHRHPWLGFALTVFMLSAASFPATAGFLGKVWLFGPALLAGRELGWSDGGLVLVVSGLLASVVGAAYYFRAILHLWARTPVHEVMVRDDARVRWVVLVLAAALLWYGLVPSGMFWWAEAGASALAAP